MVDLNLSNLPKNADVIGVKKMAGVKHVIGATVAENNMTGVCTGTGKIQIRLNHGETLEQVELNFASKGIMISENKPDHSKRPKMTGVPREHASEVTDHKNHKQKFL